MDLDDLEETLKPLLIVWKESFPELDFGDFIHKNKDSFILELLVKDS